MRDWVGYHITFMDTIITNGAILRRLSCLLKEKICSAKLKMRGSVCKQVTLDITLIYDTDRKDATIFSRI